MRQTILLLVLFAGTTALAYQPAVCDLEVVVDGATRPEYDHHGTTYVEALRGREYVLRVSNPTSHRVAVALSVDGLNTIDAKHTDGWSASKWVLDPWETIVISGWQVSDSAARRFYFTGERDSYAASRGAVENLGVIEAVFFRERSPRPVAIQRERFSAAAPPASAASPQAESRSKAQESGAAAADDAYAATGMGDRTRHDVRRVQLDLEPQPLARVRIRYEFRPQLVKLGVLPRIENPLERRERAHGFDSWCPE